MLNYLFYSLYSKAPNNYLPGKLSVDAPPVLSARLPEVLSRGSSSRGWRWLSKLGYGVGGRVGGWLRVLTERNASVYLPVRAEHGLEMVRTPLVQGQLLMTRELRLRR